MNKSFHFETAGVLARGDHPVDFNPELHQAILSLGDFGDCFDYKIRYVDSPVFLYVGLAFAVKKITWTTPEDFREKVGPIYRKAKIFFIRQYIPGTSFRESCLRYAVFDDEKIKELIDHIS